MKKLLILAALAALGGCATAPNNAPYYGAVADPGQWHVVSVTPVAPGTGQRIAAESPNGSSVQYTSEPVTVVQQPVYVPAPLYVRDPYPYYYPPVSFGLGLSFGRSWGHRSFGGVGIGTHWRR